MTRLANLAAAALVIATGLAVTASAASAAQYGHQQPQVKYQPQVQFYVQGPDNGPRDWRYRHHRRDHQRFDRRGPQPQFYTQFAPQPQFYNQYAPPIPAYTPGYTYSPPDAPWLHILSN